MMRALAEIDLGAITHNIRTISARTSAKVLAVVKADAYGHGLIPVAQAALDGGAHYLGVALLEEAISLRTAGIAAPIIAWLTPLGSDFQSALAQGIELSVPSTDIFREILAASEESGIKPRIHVEVDTGMSRGGFLDDWNQFLLELKEHHNEVEISGFWSHFARADEPSEAANAQQLSNFEFKLAQLLDLGIHPTFIHFANSAATLTNTDAHKDIVRVGIAMYGLSPDITTMGEVSQWGLQPAMTLKAILHLVKHVPAGSAVGYGGTAVLDHDTKLGVVAMGYADGISRRTSSDAAVTVNGERAHIIGRVSMDQFVVDLGISSTAKAGDMVTVFGHQASSVDEWAQAAGTINYEIVTRIGPRVPRIYLH